MTLNPVLPPHGGGHGRTHLKSISANTGITELDNVVT
jgi:hypothetical protein